MKTAFIIFSTSAIKIHKFSSSLICHTWDSERAASSMLHDLHKTHHPSSQTFTFSCKTAKALTVLTTHISQSTKSPGNALLAGAASQTVNSGRCHSAALLVQEGVPQPGPPLSLPRVCPGAPCTACPGSPRQRALVEVSQAGSA